MVVNNVAFDALKFVLIDEPEIHISLTITQRYKIQKYHAHDLGKDENKN